MQQDQLCVGHSGSGDTSFFDLLLFGSHMQCNHAMKVVASLPSRLYSAALLFINKVVGSSELKHWIWMGS